MLYLLAFHSTMLCLPALRTCTYEIFIRVFNQTDKLVFQLQFVLYIFVIIIPINGLTQWHLYIYNPYCTVHICIYHCVRCIYRTIETIEQLCSMKMMCGRRQLIVNVLCESNITTLDVLLPHNTPCVNNVLLP